MKHLHIDIETFSSVDIVKSGMYKYCESPDFTVLLIAYAFGNSPIELIDLEAGEQIPDTLLDALTDPNVLKYAHNAAFERTALAKIGIKIPVQQMVCTSLLAAYCGLPLSLGPISSVLKLGKHAKLASGKALIKYFCVPCKPTRVNGKREINLAVHDTEKWEQFKEYCKQDVAAERELVNVLKAYTPPKEVIQGYWIDQKINDLGVKLDTDLASNALRFFDLVKDEALEKMREITGVDNPNSPSQLTQWLTERLERPINSLAKEQLKQLEESTADVAVLDLIALRKEAGKTSAKKYEAMDNVLCQDGRVRGLLHYYGANRTGRWAGRLIQVQNLPRNNMKDIDDARELVRTGQYALFKMRYGKPAQVLSELIRTTFVPKKGHTFIVYDFSAIEARVIAWLAGEQWRLDVFSTHGKIYEASASMMFGVPIEEIGKGSDLRSKGKIAELALGYQGAVGALKNMGGDKMGLSEDDMKGIVDQWRKANPSIVGFWYAVEEAAIRAVKTGRLVYLSNYQNLTFKYDGTALTVRLPSGRELFYWKPVLRPNKWGKQALFYEGMNQTTKKWELVDYYGGKGVENIVQAVARDILLWSMAAINKGGVNTVMHVHDEVVCEVPDDKLEEAEKVILSAMEGDTAPNNSWAKGLPLAADGFMTKYYKKD